MNKWLLLLLTLTGCAVSTAVDKPRLANITSFAQPLVAQGQASQVSIVNWELFQWSDDDPSVASFNLYYSTTSPHVYDNVITGITNLNCAISNMVPGTTYYLGVTAVDTNGVESDFSPQAIFLMPTTLEFGFAFDTPVTNISVQSSTDLISWQPSIARLRTNGLWRTDINPSVPVQFYRGVGQSF